MKRCVADSDVVVSLAVRSDPVQRRRLLGQGRREAAFEDNVLAFRHVDLKRGLTLSGNEEKAWNAKAVVSMRRLKMILNVLEKLFF